MGSVSEDDLLQFYFSALRNYQDLNVEEENKLVQNLTDTERQLRSVLAQFPGSSLWLMNPDRRGGGRTQQIIGGGLFSRSKPEPDIAAFVSPERDPVQIDKQMTVMLNLHGDLIASTVRHGADHPICRERRRLLASEFRNLPFSPGYVSRLVHQLLTLARELTSVQRRFGQQTSAQRSPAVFEKQYGIGLPEFNRIVNQVMPLHRQWQLARNSLVEVHLGFVVYLAKQYPADRVDFLDLIQEGNIGLIKAVERFDCRLGFKFSTYASYWIRLEISRFVARNGHLLRLPYRLHRRLGFIKRNAALFRQLNGRDPTETELAQNTGIAVTGLRAILRSSQPVSALDRPLEDNQDVSLLSLAEQHIFPQPEDEAANLRLKEFIDSAIIMLTKQEAFVVRQRFGIGTYRECSLQEIGDVLGVTRERIRQIEAQAIKKLRYRLTSAGVPV